jgi:hypothetical protein
MPLVGLLQLPCLKGVLAGLRSLAAFSCQGICGRLGGGDTRVSPGAVFRICGFLETTTNEEQAKNEVKEDIFGFHVDPGSYILKIQ